MKFNPIIEEGAVPADRHGIWTRTTASGRLAALVRPDTVLVLEREAATPAGDRFVVFDPNGPSGDLDAAGFVRFYLVDQREHVVTWEIPIATGSAVVYATAVAVVAVSVPATTVVEQGVRDAEVATSPEVERLFRHIGGDGQAGDLRAAAAQLRKDLVGHRFGCGLALHWINVALEPTPELAEHRAKLAEQDFEHELAMRRIELENVRIERETAQHQRRADLEQLKRNTQVTAARLSAEATREAEQIARAAHDAAEQARVAAVREAEQIRRAAHDEADEVKVAAVKEAEQIRRAAHGEADEVKVAAVREAGQIRRAARDEADELKVEAVREAEEVKRTARRAVSDAEIRDAARLNNELAAHPAKMMGYLLAMDDTTSVREAIKILEERERAAWNRLKELEKLELLGDEDIRSLAVALLHDPAGGAFGLEVEPPPGSTGTEQLTGASSGES